MPTNGIQPIHDVTIPKILPAEAPPSFFVKTSVTMCRASIKTKGVYERPRIMAPPRMGIPQNASNPPVINFMVLDVDITKTSYCLLNSFVLS